ncbi:restriction endonuclease subunit S [Streptomyces sp. TRM 70361]|uniref:restriction endonuclease subunit S n=1 Tax=Streptomyces sp. TRM 70361 TaxID=3116553 RepID=UPI002E7B9F36|nr:restriction endonuclease subunit S [Streptomyces sp. TRM 70361]MEE1941957.1 restriction endonuclease subunit S [Streptomyces sp. TRM 70361]
MTKLKRVATTIAGGTPAVHEPSFWSDNDEEGLPWVSIGDMSGHHLVTNTSRRVTSKGISATRLPVGEPGTLLLSMYASLGHTAFLTTQASWNQAILGIDVSSTHAIGFVRYALEAIRPSLAELARSNTQANLNAEQVGNLVLPDPPLDEQRRIADFLDAETTRIDVLTSARERQLALLTERFLARVFNTVRGSNESDVRKNSGLDWLGTIPSTWPVMPVTYQFEVILGKMLNQERSHGTHLAPYLRNTNVQWDRIDTEDLLQMDFPPEESKRYALQQGDLLVCEGGEPGRAAVWQGHMQKVYYQKALHRVRARAYSSPRWLFYCLRAATAQNVFAVEGNTTTIAHLTGEQFRAHRFPFPDRKTQDRLTAKLDADNQSQRQLEKKLHQQIALLAERRQALITAAVTGQFDVATASGRNVTEGVSS